MGVGVGKIEEGKEERKERKKEEEKVVRYVD